MNILLLASRSAIDSLPAAPSFPRQRWVLQPLPTACFSSCPSHWFLSPSLSHLHFLFPEFQNGLLLADLIVFWSCFKLLSGPTDETQAPHQGSPCHWGCDLGFPSAQTVHPVSTLYRTQSSLRQCGPSHVCVLAHDTSVVYHALPHPRPSPPNLPKTSGLSSDAPTQGAPNLARAQCLP